MTYGRFLLLFLGFPLGLTLVLLRRRLNDLRWFPFLLLFGVVYLSTSLWDNAAVKHGLWSFDTSKTWGVKLGYLPLEEYCFFGLQALLTGLWVWTRLPRTVRA